MHIKQFLWTLIIVLVTLGLVATSAYNANMAAQYSKEAAMSAKEAIDSVKVTTEQIAIIIEQYARLETEFRSTQSKQMEATQRIIDGLQDVQEEIGDQKISQEKLIKQLDK